MAKRWKGSGNPNFGKPLSAATRAKLSAGRRGVNNPYKRVCDAAFAEIRPEIIALAKQGWDNRAISRRIGRSVGFVDGRERNTPDFARELAAVRKAAGIPAEVYSMACHKCDYAGSGFKRSEAAVSSHDPALDLYLECPACGRIV